MRDLNTLVPDEMNADEWLMFKLTWIINYADELMHECDMDLIDAERIADLYFEDYLKDKGYLDRNKRS